MIRKASIISLPSGSGGWRVCWGFHATYNLSFMSVENLFFLHIRYTGAWGQDTASPFLHPTPPSPPLKKNHSNNMPFSDCQSTDAIRKRHLYIHISRLMQSENGISIYISVD